MDYQSELIKLSEKLIPEINLHADQSLHKNQFIKQLSPYLAQLLDQDFQKLVQIMYRIDVSEKEFALTLRPDIENNIPEALAGMIYERLLLKAKIRTQYKAK